MTFTYRKLRATPGVYLVFNEASDVLGRVRKVSTNRVGNGWRADFLDGSQSSTVYSKRSYAAQNLLDFYNLKEAK